MNPWTRRICIMFALGLLTACNRDPNVKIGIAAPMTGQLAQYGRDIVNGAQTAVDELNADHFTINGKRAHFELVVEDDKASPAKGKLAAQHLIDAKVNAVFGHFNSRVTISASSLYERAGIPQLSVSTNPQYTRRGLKTAFRLTADDIRQGDTLGLLISNKLHAKSIYMVDDGKAFGIGLAEEVAKIFKSKNITPPHDSVNSLDVDYPALIKKIKSSKANVVFFGGDQVVGLPLLNELRKSGSTATFVVADAMCDAAIVEHADGDADSNYYCTKPEVPPSWLSANSDFTQLYAAKYGVPGSYATLAYDGVHILAQAMQDANSSDPATYLPFLAKGSFDGKVQGAVEFDAKGDIKDGTVVIYQAIGGQLIEQRSE